MIPLLAAACGTGSTGGTSGGGGNPDPERTDDPKSAPGDPGALVLRAKTVGGIAGLGGPGSMPDLSVYGGGRVIARGSGSGSSSSGSGGSGADGSGWPVEYRLTSLAYERLVADAREAGLSTPRTIDDTNVSDSFYTVITFAADGTPTTTKVIQMGGRGGQVAAFAARLKPGTWPTADLATEPVPYKPVKVAVLAIELTAAMAAEKWPFGELGSGPKVGIRTCTELTGADIERARRLAQEDKTLWHDEDGTYRVAYRPLLPDEPGCAAIALTRS